MGQIASTSVLLRNTDLFGKFAGRGAKGACGFNGGFVAIISVVDDVYLILVYIKRRDDFRVVAH